ncbi:hypothetical protein ACFTRD_15060 [Paenibacillus sp. NPDC056933]|uniref:hypothetical protein n=1 Tax=Paenibacillus sp. NPDC056933 TaxID=3345968 RepID=UPI0036257F9C
MELTFQLLLNDDTEWLLGNELEDVLSQNFQLEGFTLQKSHQGDKTKYMLRKVYDSYENLLTSNDTEKLDRFIDTQIKHEEKWLYSNYRIIADLKPKDYMDDILGSLDNNSISETVAWWLVQDIPIEFRLTMPFDLYGSNNAATQDGDTLTWYSTLDNLQPMELEMFVPNIRNISITIGVVILVALLVVLLYIRFRKKQT